MELDKAIKERHSVRKFTSKKVKWQDIIDAIDAANLAPLAGNLSSLRFILVDDQEKIQKLANACQQDFISSVKYVVVICTDPAQLVRNYDEKGQIYSRQQAGAAIENFLLKIVDLGLATCWTGAFVESQVKNILAIPDKDNINVEALFPIGYEFGDGKQRKKTDLDNVLYFNKWKEKRMKGLDKVEAL